MRKVLCLLCTILLFTQIQKLNAQSVVVGSENFDRPVSFSVQQTTGATWAKDTSLYVSFPNSFRGMVPNTIGDSIILTSPIYDFTNYEFVQMSFSQICKISPSDIARVEYRLDAIGAYGQWQPIPVSAYQGNGTYTTSGFNALSYSAWQGYDSLAIPTQGWWITETFNLTNQVGFDRAQFRFIIKKGNVLGSNISYGWLIDNFIVTASTYEIKPPIVEFLSPFIQDTLYSTGPFIINAKVKTNTNARINNPWLKYTSNFNGNTKTDSVLMTNVSGDSLWKATIPQFVYGTAVNYEITGSDTVGNSVTINSGYVIARPSISSNVYNSVALKEIVSPYQLNLNAGTNTPITVIIKNKGILNLDSCRIGYSINGVAQNETLWTGSLPEDFDDSVTLGYYIPSQGGYDTIEVWVNTPNGVQDTITNDDQITSIVFGCNGPFSGIINIGPNSEYNTIDDALYFLSICGIRGDVVFALESGVHTASYWNFTNLGQSTLGFYKLTIRSAAMNADSVILQTSSTTRSILFANSENITISHITIDAIAKNTQKGIQFTNNATNINISHCKILVDPTSNASSYVPIYKGSNTGILTNCRINNNIIDGGYYGIYMYAGFDAQNHGNILIDSNIITNQYYYGMYTYYSDLSVHANTINSRINNSTSNWYGIYSYYCNGSVTCNKVKTLKMFQYPQGIYFSSCGDTANRILSANNEIYINATSSYYGHYISSSFADIINNSIYVDGNSTRALYISASNTNYTYTIKNNIFVATGKEAYPIYLSSATGIPAMDIDYNCYYAPTYIGYAGGNKTNMSDWTSSVNTDVHSVNINPSYIDISVNQKLSNYNNLSCPIFNNITSDIDNNPRIITTSMGAYAQDIVDNDGALLSILGWNANLLTGDTTTIKVVIANPGNNIITSMTIDWQFNGVNQTPCNYTGTLLTGELDTIELGTITYISQINTLSAWVSSVNNTTDISNANDTVSVSDFICSGKFSGTFVIGPSGFAPTINEALTLLNACGVSGSITLALDSGQYVEYVTLSLINGMTVWDTLTLTSVSGNKEDVWIWRAGDASLNRATVTIDMDNVIVKDLTITSYSTLNNVAYSYAHCVSFARNCKNIEFDNCRLRNVTTFSSTVTSTNYVALFNDGNTINNLKINDCILSGSTYAMYFLGNGSSNVSINNCRFDSADLAAFYCTNTSFSSFNNNLFAQRYSSTVVPINFTGIHLDGCSGDILNNTISSVQCENGIYLTNFNNSKSRIVGNNEIYAIDGNGISIENSKASIIHNSVLCLGDTTASALYVNYGNALTIKNNNFITKTSVPDYPIFIENASDAKNFIIDYNNYYSQNGTYLAYIGNNINSISDLRTATGQDMNSVINNTQFLNESSSLILMDSVGLSCPSLSELTTDKIGINRGTLTSMGAYHFEPSSIDASIASITASNVVEGTPTDVKIQLYNAGLTSLSNVIIDWTVNGVLQTPYTWTGNLTSKALSSEFTIGNFMPTIGDIEIVAFVSNTNNTTDQKTSNDTISTILFGCRATMKGTYIIGQSPQADFSDPNEAIIAMENCGIDSAIRFEMESGSYYPNIIMTQSIPGSSATNTIHFTSQSGIASDVFWGRVTLGNVNNLIFTNMSFDGVTNNYYSIRFISSCDNIEISDCILYGDSTNTNVAAVSAVSHQQNAGSLTNFRMYRNHIYGGNYSVYFYGSDNQHDEITLEDNIMEGSNGYGVYAYHTDLKMKNNTISNKVSSTTTSYYGIYTYYSNAEITNTSIFIESNVKSSVYGIHTYYSNADIVKNTISMQLKNASTLYGIYSPSSNNYETYHNIIDNDIDIYNSNGTTFYGIQSTYSFSNISNNNLRINTEGTTMYCLNLNYADAATIKNNIVNVERCKGATTFYGIYANYCQNKNELLANKIWMADTAKTTCYGIYTTNFGIDNDEMSLIANNELSLLFSPTANNQFSGIYLSVAKTHVLHNSLRIGGGSTYRTIGISHGTSSSAQNTVVVKNNNIEMLSAPDFPVYLPTTSTTYIGSGPGKIEYGYNNLVAPQYVGYAAGNRTTIDAWKTAIKDSTSVSIQQDYIDSSISLQVSNDTDFICPAVVESNMDILNIPRYGNTIMGAYGTNPAALDLAIIAFNNLKYGNSGDTISPSITIQNVGTEPITSTTINWSFNNVIQNPISWSGNLNILDLDTILVSNSVTLLSGTNSVKAWISNVNGIIADSIATNDTISFEIYACDSALNGIYTIGSTGDFATIDEVVNNLKYCGINGDITFEFLPEVHTGNLKLTETINGSDKYTILFTKANMNSTTPAIIRPITGNAVELKGQHNIYFDSLTIDANTNSASIGVKIHGTSSNIAFTNCNILAKKGSTNSNYGFYKPSGGKLDSLLIRNCFISGGYYGVYVYAGSSQTACGYITIDSNIMTDSYYYGLYTYYANGNIDNNLIKTYSSSSTSWCGIYNYYGHLNIRNNKIHSIARTLSSGYGLYSTYHNSSVDSEVDIINNEIILKSTGTNRGMYFQYTHRTNIIHNSIYLNSTGGAYGVYFTNSTSTTSYYGNVVKNNNIVVTSTNAAAAALYLGNISNASPSVFVLDYNNYYAGSGVVSNIANVLQRSIPDQQTMTGQDANSVVVYPSFVDSSIDLSVNSGTGLICLKTSRVPQDINNVQRDALTVMGAYTLDVFSGIDLELTQIVEPINSTTRLCSPSYTSVKYAIANVGGADIDFSKDPMRLTIKTTGANDVVIDTIISSGILRILEVDTFEVTNALFVDYEGTYHLEASLSCAADSINTENDTIFSVYQTNKINLPYDEDFSSSLLEALTIESLVGSEQWSVLAGNNNGYIDPFFGSGKLAFTGSRGSISRLSTAQIELKRTSQPTLEFWYAHDTSDAALNDQLNISVTFDGGLTHHSLIALNRYNDSISVPSWIKYTIDLSPYADSACAIIVFDAISYGGTQYIDRIVVSSLSNISLTDALAIDVDVCNIENRTFGIEMTNQTGQAIDFSTNRTSIVVEISGAANQTLTLPLLSGTIEGLDVDTLAISNNFNFLPGTYNVKAYISPAVDNTLADDTVYKSIVINPSLSVLPTLVTGGTNMNNCITAGSSVFQEVIIANDGNMDMSNLILTLNVYDISGVLTETIIDSISGTFAVNQIDTHTFASSYTAPSDEIYTIQVIVNPACNANFSFEENITECVDLNDIEIVAILNPDANNNTCSKVGEDQQVIVKVANKNPNEDVSAINIYAAISDGNSILTTLAESIDEIPANDIIEYTFSRTFNVPNVNNYSVIVFVDRYDANAQNDTLSISKCTDLGISETSANEINMSQNIPNPANNMAKVDYSIPTQGKVVFTIASVTGQILHTQEIEAEAGIHSIEFNTANLASGIYFYTMDFNGQRLTKKMTIRK